MQWFFRKYDFSIWSSHYLIDLWCLCHNSHLYLCCRYGVIGMMIPVLVISWDLQGLVLVLQYIHLLFCTVLSACLQLIFGVWIFDYLFGLLDWWWSIYCVLGAVLVAMLELLVVLLDLWSWDCPTTWLWIFWLGWEWCFLIGGNRIPMPWPIISWS